MTIIHADSESTTMLEAQIEQISTSPVIENGSNGAEEVHLTSWEEAGVASPPVRGYYNVGYDSTPGLPGLVPPDTVVPGHEEEKPSQPNNRSSNDDFLGNF